MAGLAIKEGYQGLAAAVSLGITVLKRTKQNTWAELTAAMSATDPVVVKAFKVLELDDAQIGLIMEHQPELGLIRIAPAVIPVICPACGHYILSSDTASTRCLVTPGCAGKPFKVAAAVTAKKPVEVTETEPGETQAAPEATPQAVPELAVLEANMEAAVETVKDIVEGLHEVEALKAEAAAAETFIEEFLAAETTAAPEGEEVDEAPPPPPAPRGRIELDDDNGFD